MSREHLSVLEGAQFDVAVIGAGINGSSAAQHQAAEGFSVLLVDAQDFGAGASSRSSRMMHFGLRYLDRGEPIWNYVANPGWFIKQCFRARDTMRHRAELVRTMPARMKPYTMHIPIYLQDHTAPWQMSLGLQIINLLGGPDVPVKWEKFERGSFDRSPFAPLARDQDQLQSVFAVQEFQFDWPERLVADYTMDACRMGAVCRNYTEAVAFDQVEGAGWALTLRDVLSPDNTVRVDAKQIVNTTGPWIDQLLKGAAGGAGQQVEATKGSHIALRLPEAFHGHAFAHFNRRGYPFYVCPWRDLHFVGPTETPFSGDPGDVRVTEDDVAFLLTEVNHMLPGLKISAEDILFHWSGVRPMPFIAGYKGKQNLIPEFNDHGTEGMANLLSVPGGPLMVHRYTGRQITAKVAEKIAPAGARHVASFDTVGLEENTNSPPVNAAYPDIRLSHLQQMAREELPASLSDLLLRRAGLGWTHDLSQEAARAAAEAVAADMGWDAAQIDTQVADYRRFVQEHFVRTG